MSDQKTRIAALIAPELEIRRGKVENWAEYITDVLIAAGVILPNPPSPTFHKEDNYFLGHAGSPCLGHHRTTGDRAWCSEDSQWCYPDNGCVGCRFPEGI